MKINSKMIVIISLSLFISSFVKAQNISDFHEAFVEEMNQAMNKRKVTKYPKFVTKNVHYKAIISYFP